MQDEKIVELYWQRDESAIHETQEKYETYLYKIAYNILSDEEDSMESVNDTYLAAWNSMPPHRPNVLSTYLGKLTRRISIDIFRKRNRVKRQSSEYALSLTELEDCISSNDSPEKDYEAQVLGEVINTFLHTLSNDARNVFIGRYYFLDSVKDVANYCGISEAKAKALLFRTRNSLKEYLIKEGYEL
ncbi:MAG: sigma-70 family RNA polymerase sigma factor [Clostridia bacterium]|nr:sigma-70 family RNA polymerase sigma factor [Clostridia bacterium]